VADYTQAIMDLGATLCVRRNPSCADCPLASRCQARLADAVDQYPGKARRKTLPVRQTRMLLIRDPSGAVMLEQRPTNGIWGGLWSLPEASLDEDPRHCCKRLTGRVPLEASDLPGFRHTFSHYHLDIAPTQLAVAESMPSVEPGSRVWYKPGQMRLGLAAPVVRLLADTSPREAIED